MIDSESGIVILLTMQTYFLIRINFQLRDFGTKVKQGIHVVAETVKEHQR